MSTSTKTPAKTPNPAVGLGDLAALQQLRKAIQAGQLTDLAIFEDLDIVRRGKQLILPEGMSYDQAIAELNRRKEAEEKVVSVHHSIRCFPLDGVVAFHKAFLEIYGHVTLMDQSGFWGPEPPTMIQIPIANGQFVSAPLGKMAPTLWEGGSLTPDVGRSTELIISGSVKRKFESAVQQICRRTAEILRENSIYRRQSIILDFKYLEEGRQFHPVNDAPKFWNVANITDQDLIVNDETWFVLQTKLFLRIEKPEVCRRNDIPLKAGALFMGSYGTGKTLAAKLVASKAVQNGWTFIYLKNAAHTAEALRIAALYAPAVLFAEDIDQATDGDRDETLNDLLNTLDGVDTKDGAIISIFTTNHPENISKAFLRAGRMDVIVPFEAPDAKTAPRFVDLYSKDAEGIPLLADDIDEAAVGAAIAGMKPAFIANVVQSAKARALYRSPDDPTITTEDLVVSARASRQHAEMISDKAASEPKDRVVEGLHFMAEAMRGNVPFNKYSGNGNGHAATIPEYEGEG